MTVPVPVVSQPWSEIVWPEAWRRSRLTASQLRGIPAIGRALSLIGGMAKQMPLDAVRGDVVLPRPPLLEQPDPTASRSWLIDVLVEDYVVHGNALLLVTSRDAAGWPLSVMWLPAALTTATRLPDGQRDYWHGGVHLETQDVIHVRRGADSTFPWCGVGVLEQYCDAAGLLADQGTYQARVLDSSAVPSVVIITPEPEVSQTEADAAKEAWVEKYAGTKREPAILPKGTEVKPLAWSPADSQLTELSKLGLTSAANMMNLDGYWLGAASGSYSYKSPGPMYLNLLRQTVGPILEDFEGELSAALLPRGQRVRFRRSAVLGDDMATTIGWVRAAVAGGLMTLAEGRVALGLGADVPEELRTVEVVG